MLNKPKWNMTYQREWFISHKAWKRESPKSLYKVKLLIPQQINSTKE